MGNRVVPAIWFGDHFLESLRVGSAQLGQRRSEIRESAGNGLWKGEAHLGIGLNEFPCLQEVGAPTWGPAEDMAPLVESVLPKGSQFLEKGRRLRELLGIQGALSSSVWMGIREDRLAEILLPDQISGPPEG